MLCLIVRAYPLSSRRTCRKQAEGYPFVKRLRVHRFIFHTSFSLRLAVLIVLISAALTNWPENRANAGLPTTKVSLLPALTAGSIKDYGLHFDEGGASYGAYDYSGTTGTAVYLRGKADEYQTFSARYKYRNFGSCGVEAVLQRYIDGSWTDIANFDQHYLHLGNRPGSTWQYSQAITHEGNQYSKQVGTIALCGTAEAHAHHSAHLGGTISAAGKSNDTCWANGSQCNIGEVRKHYTCSQSNGTDPSTSGNITQYICETWSAEWRSSSITAFQIP